MIDEKQNNQVSSIFKNKNLGWFIDKGKKGTISGTYIHGILENDSWRNSYINMIRKQKDLPQLDIQFKPYKIKQDQLIDDLADQFKKHIDISLFLNR